jgi:hypothetical protein
MSTPTGRHRKPRREPKIKKTKSPHGDSPRTGMMFNTVELVLMILLGTVGVLMVLAARPYTHRNES